MNCSKAILLYLLFCIETNASTVSVRSICEQASGLPVVALKYRHRNSNLEILKGKRISKLKAGQYLQETAKISSEDEPRLAEAAKFGNEKFRSPSDLKSDILQFSTRKQKIADLVGYHKKILELFDRLVPPALNRMNWFLTYKSEKVSETSLRPASESEMQDLYGAVMKPVPLGKNKFRIEIVYSLNDSETIPYLIPLIAHEIQHAESFENGLKAKEDEQKFKEFSFIDEAVGFNTQMKVYLELAKKNPEIFCDWLVPSWSYGNVVIPLSWVMVSMEKEMADGSLLLDYAKSGIYAKSKFLLDSKEADLRSDLKEKIEGLKLEYVRFEGKMK